MRRTLAEALAVEVDASAERCRSATRTVLAGTMTLRGTSPLSPGKIRGHGEGSGAAYGW